MRILLWHVHGSWTTSFVSGAHDYLLPVTPDRGPYGAGLATTWDWSATTREVPYERLRDEHVDVVVLQRPEELPLVRKWLGREPGRELPAIFMEHNTPKGGVPSTRHPLADQAAVPLVHCTSFNALFWDNGRAPVRVIEHGIVDPGERYTGKLARAAVVVNEPVRRARVTGSDLLPAFARAVPLDVYGMQVLGLPEAYDLPTTGGHVAVHEDLPQHRMHAELARRRVYVHPLRWTSLGLSLLEAMQLGMPVVVLAATEAVEAVPPEAGVLSTRLDVLVDGARRFVDEPDAARLAGKAARAYALERYGLPRFLADWDALVREVVEG
ncbi:MAG: glycosyltransferase [Actinomycetota bacterium]|nr:glycosyltransferase [Actinomycetota bacterium]